MLDVDERREPAALLRLRDHGQRECRLTGRFRPINLDHASAWKTADAERAVDQNVAGRNDGDIDNFLATEAHDRAFAVILGDLLNGEIEIFVSGSGYFIDTGFFFSFRGHRIGGFEL